METEGVLPIGDARPRGGVPGPVPPTRNPEHKRLRCNLLWSFVTSLPEARSVARGLLHPDSHEKLGAGSKVSPAWKGEGGGL